MTGLRIALGVLGVVALGYGAGRLLLGAQDVVVLPVAVLAVGAALQRLPDRARGFVQAGLIMVGAVMIIAMPLLLRQRSQPAAKAMLLQDYGLNLAVLVVIIVVGTLIAYGVARARSRAH